MVERNQLKPEQRGWLTAFVAAGLAAALASIFVDRQSIRGVVSGVGLIVQLIAFSKVWRKNP